MKFAALTVCVLLPFLSPREELREIDLYGLRAVSRAEVIAALGADVGDDSEFDREAAEARLRALPGVAEAQVTLMARPGHHTLMLGVEEVGASRLELRPEPTGEVRLPDELVALHEQALELTMEGLMAGNAGEEVIDGYGLSEYGPARECELELIERARAHSALLTQVLVESADARHRATAASCIAYLPDKRAIQVPLAAALRDPDSGVRNNATRALMVLADWANDRSDFDCSFDWAPLVTLLDSVHWTDRNKASNLLLHLSEGRDPELLRALGERSLPALVEMASWSLDGYSYPSKVLLARIAGRPEAELREAIQGLGRADCLAWIDELRADALDLGQAAGLR